jgi:hypothetical protein
MHAHVTSPYHVGPTAVNRNPTAHLVANYRPSQPHGWPASGPDEPVGVTIGGHTTATDFTYNGRSYRIGLLPFGQPGDSPDPVYEDTPTDATVNYKQTLTSAFGASYSFRYLGGFPGRGEFNVQSYTVFVTEPTQTSPLLYGADLYVVYDPDERRGDPPIRTTLRWIQVARSSAVPGVPTSFVDNVGRANPFSVTGGVTSVYGTRTFSFAYSVTVPLFPGAGGHTVLSDQFLAEIFLVRDTGLKDETGKDVINVYGGLKYGWQVQAVLP